MGQVVGEVVYLLANVARKSLVSLNWDPSTAPLRVFLPEGEVKQILYNIIRNAIQATPPAGVVKVWAATGDEEISIHVQDQGTGIPADVLPRIFDPFFSTKQGASPTGMGLGLSVSRSLIEAMGGRIEVATELGRGSCFTMTFPVEVETAEEESHE